MEKDLDWLMVNGEWNDSRLKDNFFEENMEYVTRYIDFNAAAGNCDTLYWMPTLSGSSLLSQHGI